MSGSKFKIKVNILGKDLPMIVTSEQEEEIRKAEKLIKEKYESYKEHYKNVEDDIIFAVMILLDLARTSVKAEKSSDIFGIEILDELSELNTLVEDYLYPHQNRGKLNTN